MNFKTNPTFTIIRQSLLVFVAGLLLFAASCKKDNSYSYSPEEKIEVTAEGTPTGIVKTAVIGPSGGKLLSEDGKLEISIPAGALAANTSISVAPITNTSSAGFGLNYRITPHMTFAKPAKLTFSYAAEEDSIANIAAIGIGYRDENGVWQLKRRSKIDQATKKISVETDHFSDWAALQLVKFTPGYSRIEQGASVTITPLTCVKLTEIYDLDKVFDPNGPDGSLPIVEPYELPSDYVIDMYVIGGERQGMGKLKATGESSAIYTASNDVLPPVNPVTIAFPLTTSTSPRILTARVQVETYGSGVTIRMDGKEYHYDGTASINAGLCEIDFTRRIGTQTSFFGTMAFAGDAGTKDWNNSSDFMWEPEGLSPKRVYQHLFNDGMTISGGSISVALIGPPGEYVMGTFIIQNSGATNTESGNGEYLGAKRVEGAFKVKREY